jgi:chromosome segregation ATPase
MQDAQVIVTASDVKMKELTVSVATLEAQKVAQVDVMTKTQTAVPLLKAALAQATAALAALPENAEIKTTTESLAAVTDRQEKSIVAMTEQIAVMDKAMTDAKTEMEAAAKTIATATETMQTAEKSMQALTAEVPAIEAVVTTATAALTTAEQA